MLEAPRFVERVCSLEVTEGDAACFTVAVSGRPAPQVRWRHNDSEVVEGGSPYFEVIRSADGRHHSLRIGEVFADDAGMIDVTASNDAGSVSASAHLSVRRQYLCCRSTDGLAQSVDHVALFDDRSLTRKSS